MQAYSLGLTAGRPAACRAAPKACPAPLPARPRGVGLQPLAPRRHRPIVAAPRHPDLRASAADNADGKPGNGSPVPLAERLQDVYFYLNVAYVRKWSLLLLSVLTGSDLLGRITHFETYTTAMFCASVAFAAYSGVACARDAMRHLKAEADADWRLVLRYGWNAVFWLGFVLWYVMPPVPAITEYTGTAGAIMSLFGVGLALSAALLVGMWSFMGEPQVPRRLVTAGPYLLCRHPQALGNLLFLIGFSLAGGALWASAAFAAALVLYAATVVPREEAQLEAAFGESYRSYARRVPPYRYALLLLVVLEVVLLRRFAPWSVTPIEVVPRPA